MKKLIAFVLLMSILMLSSCQYIPFLSEDEKSDDQSKPEGDEIVNGNHPDWDFYPKGYTGGFRHDQPGYNVEYWWVETYEECVAAIELLKSHDSTFSESVIFTYEGDLFDTKYCFEIPRDNTITEDIEFGDDPFDRRGGNVLVCSYAFFDYVTIDEINHSYVSEYKCCVPLMAEERTITVPDLTPIQLSYQLVSYSHGYSFDGWFSVDENKQRFHLGSYGYGENKEKAIKCVEAVCDSAVLIGFN